MKESDRHIQAVSRALEVLTSFDRDIPLRLKELHARTGQARSGLIRVLGTLESHGFVRFDPATGAYELGSVVHRLGALLNERFSRIDQIVRPVLARLVSETSDTAFLSAVEGLRRVVLIAEESQEALRFTAREGQSRPLHLGASSKILLAWADPDTREKAMELVEPENRDALSKDLAGIVAKGFAVSEGEITPYGFAISVPVRHRGSSRVDSISLAGVLSKLTPALIDSHVERLRREAAYLEKSLPSNSDGMDR